MAITLTIIMDEQGRISVNGPIDNKLLAYGLLEVAHEVVYDFSRQTEQQKIQLASVDALAALKKPFNN